LVRIGVLGPSKSTGEAPEPGDAIRGAEGKDMPRPAALRRDPEAAALCRGTPIGNRSDQRAEDTVGFPCVYQAVSGRARFWARRVIAISTKLPNSWCTLLVDSGSGTDHRSGCRFNLRAKFRCKLAAGAPMTDHRHYYLLWTAVTREDGAGGLSYAFPDVETEIEQTLEAVVTQPVAEPSVVPRPCGGARSPVTLSVVIPLLNEAHGIDRLLAASKRACRSADAAMRSSAPTTVEERDVGAAPRAARTEPGNQIHQAFPCVYPAVSGGASGALLTLGTHAGRRVRFPCL
jgi:hypothetical protein